jgi:hypothetical protein
METETQKLSARFAELASSGLSDVKFFLRNTEEASTEHVCREVNEMYEAIKRGESKPLDFKDSYL